MTEYIEREKAKELFDDELISEYARGILDKCPAADVVKVVRCKDCRHWCPDGGYALDHNGTKCLYGECSLMRMSFRENCFCFYGQKAPY